MKILNHKYTAQKWALVVFVSLFAFGQQAFAASGDLISNIASINYSVGGTTQTVINSTPDGNSVPGVTGTATVVVEDQLINFAVVRGDADEVPISPNNTALTKFTVYNIGDAADVTAINSVSDTVSGTATTNFSNGTITVSNFAAGNSTPISPTPQNSLADTFDVNSCTYFSDSAGTIAITELTIAPNSSADVYVNCTAPLNNTAGDALVNDDAATVYFKAEVTEGWDNTAGASTDTTTDANTVGGLEFVYLDPIGQDADGAAGNGIHSATSGYKIQTVALEATKTATVVSDPVNGTTNPYAIPGAVIEYTITVENSSSTTIAQDVNIGDLLPSNFDAPSAGSITVTRSDASAGTSTVSGYQVDGGCGDIGTGTVASPAVCTMVIQVQISQ